MEEWRQGYVRLSLLLEPHHLNPHGVMQGGVITTLMDEAMGGVIASVRGMEEMWAAPHATVDMNVSFLAAARAGDEISVEGRVLKLGRTVAFGEGADGGEATAQQPFRGVHRRGAGGAVGRLCASVAHPRAEAHQPTRRHARRRGDDDDGLGDGRGAGPAARRRGPRPSARHYRDERQL